MSIEPMTTPVVTGSCPGGAAGHTAALSATGLQMLPEASAGESSGTGTGARGVGAVESDSRAARGVSAKGTYEARLAGATRQTLATSRRLIEAAEAAPAGLRQLGEHVAHTTLGAGVHLVPTQR